MKFLQPVMRAIAFVVTLILAPFAVAAATMLLLYARLFRKFGYAYMRRKGLRLQTPIVRFRHAVTKRVVDIIGVVHIGHREYFQTIQDRLDRVPKGTSVLYEAIKLPTEDERASLCPDALEAVEGILSIGKAQQNLAAQLGVAHQMDVITYRDPWIRTDATSAELARDAVAAGARFPLIVTDEDGDAPDAKRRDPFLQCLNILSFAFLRSTSTLHEVFSCCSRQRRALEKLIRHERDKIAIRGILDHAARGDVIAVWGTAHLRGISKALRKVGYTEEGSEWLTAYDGFRQLTRTALPGILAINRRK